MTRPDSTTHEDWGPYGRALFEDPEARALSRVGVVDIGSNSVRLVVFDGAARSPAYFYNEKVLCGLGSGMNETGRLNAQGKARALTAMKRFRLLADGMDLPRLTVIATAAMREAADGPDFQQEMEQATGLSVHVIDGTEEARLSAQGVLLGWPGAEGLVCDIGGSSMELAELAQGEVGRCVTSPLGPLKLRDLSGGRKAREKRIREVMKSLHRDIGNGKRRLFLVGGSWRAFAKIDMERRKYPLHVLHEYRMDVDAVRDTMAFLEAGDPDSLRRSAGVSGTRMALLPFAAEVLAQLLETFPPEDIVLSSYGIREGLLYEQMPERLRARDPLIEACRFAEAKDARLPGFGHRLHDFIRPLFPGVAEERARLMHAACLLHDVSWRAHPDYRAEVCFDNATRANLGGLRHWERVYLGLALLHRYRNKREGTRFEDLYALLDGQRQQEAEVLGKAMRFGAMLWMTDEDPAQARLDWRPETRALTLHLPKGAAPLFGEVTEARFRAMADALGAASAEVTLA